MGAVEEDLDSVAAFFEILDMERLVDVTKKLMRFVSLVDSQI